MMPGTKLCQKFIRPPYVLLLTKENRAILLDRNWDGGAPFHSSFSDTAVSLDDSEVGSNVSPPRGWKVLYIPQLSHNVSVLAKTELVVDAPVYTHNSYTVGQACNLRELLQCWYKGSFVCLLNLLYDVQDLNSFQMNLKKNQNWKAANPPSKSRLVCFHQRICLFFSP